MAPAKIVDLIDAVLTGADVYAAAALHEVADPADRVRLEALMFRRRADALALAKEEFMPPGVLGALAGRGDPAIRMRLARNVRTPRGVLTELAESAVDVQMLRLLARHHNATVAMLRQIVERTSDTEALKAVCGNPCADGRILREMAARRRGDLDALLAVNPSAGEDVLGDLWERGGPALRAAILKHPNCPPRLSKAVSAGDAPVLRRSLAGSRKVRHAALRELLSDPNWSVRRVTAANPALPGEALQRMCADPSAGVRRPVAARKDLPADCAAVLVADADRWVRQWLARNPATPRGVLEQLAGDCELEVRRAVARNPGCPSSLLARLARDSEGWVRAAVAYRDDVPVRSLKALCEDDDVDVLSGVARNPRTRQADLLRLARHPSPDVRRGVVLNRAAGWKALSVLLEDPYSLNRLLLVAQPNLHDRDKWRLRQDPDSRVRFAVFAWLASRIGQAVEAGQMVHNRL